jgi:hypothetical protein
MKGRKLLFLVLIFSFFSCTDSRIRYATEWTKEIKSKILEDANRQADSTLIDYPNPDVQEVSYIRKGRFLKKIKKRSKAQDTLSIIYFSDDQNFILAKEPCPLLTDEYVEVILYKRMTLGLHEFFYCNGKPKRSGFNIQGYVGKWKEYSQEGNVIREIDYDNLGKLDTLRKIKYYR